MIAVFDTGPINYLIQIEATDPLPTVFGQIGIPIGVRRELIHPRSPSEVRRCIQQEPDWLKILSVDQVIPIRGLQRGELEAIALSREKNASFLVLDDRAARNAAVGRTDSTVIGTLAVLFRIAQLDPKEPVTIFNQLIKRLRETNFYFSPRVENAIELFRNALRHT